jgi:hypothetical protein
MSNNNKQTNNKSQKKYLVEVVEEKPKCLLVYQKTNRFVAVFEKKIGQTHTVYQTSSLEERWTDFDLVVFFGVLPDLFDIKRVKKVFFIFFNQKDDYLTTQKWLRKHHRHYKVVNLGRAKHTIEELVETIIYKTPLPYYFNFSQKIEERPLVEAVGDPKKSLWLSLKIVLISVFFLNFLFITAFLGEVWLGYDLYQSRHKEAQVLSDKISVLKQASLVTTSLLEIPKNTLFWLPGVDDLLKIVDSTNTTVNFLYGASETLKNFNVASALIIKPNKSDDEITETKLRIKKLKNQHQDLKDGYYQIISLWEQTNIPFYNTQKQAILNKILEGEDYLLVTGKIINKLPSLLGSKEEKNYLFLFMNNMELRPGGGFIGSLAVAKVHQYSLKSLEVFDVYSLDGQLKAHISPPEPIAKYLNQPHWFLRDSNFSPDFNVNAEEALRFIKIESDWPEFDAVFGVTLTTVQRLLALFPDFYIADYNENITSDNFFIKAQYYAEKNFFPGSHGKKDFLQTVFKTLVLKIEEGNYDSWRLVSLLGQLFEEKFLVAYFNDPLLQQTFDELFWTGRVVSTECNFSKNCFSDYVYVVDANLGVNKTNLYVQRTMRLNTKISPDHTVTNTLVLDYYNQANPDIFPGGDYKNYAQIFFPKNTIIKHLLVDGEPASDYDVSTELGLRKVGLLTEIGSGSRASVTLEYEFLDRFLDKQQYQLIVQKQIGSINNDLIWQIVSPPGLSLSQSNFTPIVSRGGFVYNTFLQQDRILVVDFK